MILVPRKFSKPQRDVRNETQLSATHVGTRLQSVFDTDINVDAVKRITISSDKKIFYNRVKKNANSSLSVIFNYLDNGTVESVIRSRRRLVRLTMMPAEDLEHLGGYRRMIVVRNPFSRTLSAFLDRFRVEKIRRTHGEFSLDPEGFRQFVLWLDRGGLSRNGHWDLQSKEILMPLDRYTDVLRFESLEVSLPQFFEDVGIDVAELHQVGAYEGGRKRETNASERLKRFYDDQSMEIVARLLAPDFETLGYTPDHLQ